MSAHDNLQTDIIISGVSGHFLESSDIENYAQNLLDGHNEETSWIKTQSQQQHLVNPDLNDLAFPGIDCSQVNIMNVNSKLLATCVYDAVFDAGINPANLMNSKVGLFIGTCDLNTSVLVDSGIGHVNTTTTRNTNQLANEVVSLFKFNGPVELIENQVCSSLLLLEHARTAIQMGKCDTAIICGLDHFTQQATEHAQRIGCMFIQKASECKRSYAKLFKLNLNKSLKEVCSECRVNQSGLATIETYNTTTGGRNYLQNVSAFSGHEMPVYVRTWDNKSVMSGIEAVLKMVVMIQRGVLPASKEMNLTEVVQGKTRVCEKNVKLCDGIMALNVACGRDNFHLLLQPNTARIEKFSFWNWSKMLEPVPRLFTCSTKTRQNTEQLLHKAQQHPTDLAVQCLLESSLNPLTTPATETTEHLTRGFCILNNTNQPIQEIQDIQANKQMAPVYFIFSGLATQWQDCSKDLMQIPVFNESIRKSAHILSSQGFNDLISILQSNLETKKKTLNSFVAITAIQIALVDCLTQTGLEPAGLVGHSIGELACAYADKALSHEETIMCAYRSGMIIEQANLPESSMARVNLGWDEVQKKCPEGVFLACNNHSESVMVSGNKPNIQAFVKNLKQEGVLTEEVVDTAVHSHFMTMIAPELKHALESAIQRPGVRSSLWISTSIPEAKWKSDLAQTASAGYMLNNMCGHVLFKEAMELVPKNALCIQIGPSELLKSILHKCLPTNVHVSLIDHTSNNKLVNFWTQLGQLFLQGYYLKTIDLLVPHQLKASLYPVPVNTAFISDIAKLTYQTTQPIKTRVRRSITPDVEAQLTYKEKRFIIDVNTPEYRFLLGHKINGKCVLPVSSFVYMVWKTFAEMKNCQSVSEIPVELADIQFYEEIELVGGVNEEFIVKINSNNGEFKVLNGDRVICSGKIEENINRGDNNDTNSKKFVPQAQCVGKDEVYEKLEDKGHQLSGEFRSIVSINSQGTCGQIEWTFGKWIALLDGMMQMNVLNSPPNSLQLSELSIKSIKINPTSMLCQLHYPNANATHDYPKYFHSHLNDSFEVLSLELPTQTRLPVNWDPRTCTAICGGVEICAPVCSTNPNPNPRSGIICQVEQADLMFVAYINDMLCQKVHTSADKNDCIVDAKLQGYVTRYLTGCKELCQVMLDRIEGKSPLVCSSSALTEMDVDGKVGGKLMQILRKAVLDPLMNHAYADRVRHKFLNKCALFKAIQEDQVINSLPYDCNFKSLIDTVIENSVLQTNTTKPVLRVLEISSSLNKFYGLKLIQIMRENYPDVDVDYKFASVLKNSNQEEIRTYLGENMSFPVEMVDWDLLCENGLSMKVPDELREFDLVVFNTCLSSIRSCVQVSKGEVREWIGECARRTMKPRGFMLVHEFTQNLDNMQVLAQLEQTLQTKKPKYQFIKDSFNHDWRQTIEDLGFFPVSIKSDLCLSTLTLFRNPCPIQPLIPTNPHHGIKFLTSMTFLNIDEPNWMQACQHIIVSPGITRLILVSEHPPSAQTITQIMQLKQANTNGWKLRCVFTCDKTPVSVECLLATLEEKQKFLETEIPFGNVLMAQVLKADLFMNVFCEGKWGSLHRRNKARDLGNRSVQNKQDMNSANRSLNEQTKRMSNKSCNTKYLMPRECITKMNNIVELENNPNVIPLVFIHPIEGHVNMLKSLAKMLKCPVYGVQYTAEAMNCDSIQDLARFYWTKIHSAIGNRPVHLCGLSFGGYVALEMAALEQNKCASLTFLDGSNSYSRSTYFNKEGLDMAMIENTALFQFAENYLPEIENKHELMGQIMRCPTLKHKVKFIVDYIMENSSFQLDSEDLDEAAHALVVKKRIMETYVPEMRVNVNKVMLIRASTNVSITELQTAISKCGFREVDTHVVECDMRSMLDGENCFKIAGIMNRSFIDVLCEKNGESNQKYDSMIRQNGW